MSDRELPRGDKADAQGGQEPPTRRISRAPVHPHAFAPSAVRADEAHPTGRVLGTLGWLERRSRGTTSKAPGTEARMYGGEKTAPSIQGAGKTGRPLSTKEMRTLPNTRHENKLPMDKTYI